MEEFFNSLPDDGKEAVEKVREYFDNYKPAVQEWKGVRLIPFFSKEAAKYAYEKWSPRQEDVFIASHPRTGTHWTDEIVKQILFIGNPHYDIMNERSKHGQQYLEAGPESKFTIADYFPCRRLFDTHLPEQLVNYEKIREKQAKVIYVYRNPKDVAVSYYHFSLNLRFPPELSKMKRGDWNDYLENFMSGNNHLGQPKGEWYPYHIKSWIKHKGDGATMFIRYEDLKQNLRSEVEKIAKFLGVERTEDEIKEIIQRCSLDAMKEWSKDKKYRSGMFRKGQVGEWKNYFTVRQSEVMDEKVAKELEGVDVTFKYEI